MVKDKTVGTWIRSQSTDDVNGVSVAGRRAGCQVEGQGSQSFPTAPNAWENVALLARVLEEKQEALTLNFL